MKMASIYHRVSDRKCGINTSVFSNTCAWETNKRHRGRKREELIWITIQRAQKNKPIGLNVAGSYCSPGSLLIKAVDEFSNNPNPTPTIHPLPQEVARVKSSKNVYKEEFC